MKTYKDLNNNLFAYEEDGSQDYLIPTDFVLITESEAESIRLAKQELLPKVISPTIQELQAQLLVIQEQITKMINA